MKFKLIIALFVVACATFSCEKENFAPTNAASEDGERVDIIITLLDEEDGE